MNWKNLGAWQELLEQELAQPYIKELDRRVEEARAAGEVYPPAGREFFALEMTQPEKLRVVILGQDPYHEPNQALGLAFAVKNGVRLPPSLRNIYGELEGDLGIPPRETGDLTPWAKQGVLLLNTVLTVEKGRPNSHANWGWQRFTDGVLSSTNGRKQPIAFVLGVSQAQKKAALVQTQAPRLILTAPHPSPLSAYRGFFGSRPFSQVNDFLTAHGAAAIDW